MSQPATIVIPDISGAGSNLIRLGRKAETGLILPQEVISQILTGMNAALERFKLLMETISIVYISPVQYNAVEITG